MTTEQKIEQLRKVRAIMADPDKVVLDPANYIEDDDGNNAGNTMEDLAALTPGDHCRVCLLGGIDWMISRTAPGEREMGLELKDDLQSFLDQRVPTLVDDDRDYWSEWDPCTRALGRLGRAEVCLLLDEFEAQLRAEVSA